MAKRRHCGKEFKARVALEAIKGLKTVNQIAGEFEVHANQVSLWKKQAIENLPNAMADGRTTHNLLKLWRSGKVCWN
jgi:transposase-like protein